MSHHDAYFMEPQRVRAQYGFYGEVRHVRHGRVIGRRLGNQISAVPLTRAPAQPNSTGMGRMWCLANARATLQHFGGRGRRGEDATDARRAATSRQMPCKRPIKAKTMVRNAENC